MSITLTLFPTNTTTDADFPHNSVSANADLSDGSDSTFVARQAYASESHLCYGTTITAIPGTGIASIANVTPSARAQGDGTRPNSGGNLQGGFRVGGTTVNAFGQVFRRDFEGISGVTGTSYTTHPIFGGGWTAAQVNALGWYAGFFGYIGDGDIGRVMALQFSVTFSLTTPLVSATVASGVTTSSAIVNGTLDCNGASGTYPVSYRFDWGLTATYGNSTTVVPNQTGSGSTIVNALLSGLVANTTYHYRLVAFNTDASAVSGDQTFVTSGGDTLVLHL